MVAPPSPHQIIPSIMRMSPCQAIGQKAVYKIVLIARSYSSMLVCIAEIPRTDFFEIPAGTERIHFKEQGTEQEWNPKISREP